ncbi:MAG: B12-binding domain-containing radical SAM protein [Deltaproteobacteria bacterium]|nr:B12-binding domain-containing radical SAM protein [Deltaproteobacteria bacterium]TLN02262.1 MAG: B12-binding domain-containing radical SAM protein [bacterium]
MKLRIAFLHAVNEMDVQWYKPLSFGYLKAYLEKYGGNDFEMEYLEDPEKAENYDIIGISATSQCYDIAIGLAGRIKKACPSKVIILGGHHISALPGTLAKEIDIGVVGEGEATLLELARAFRRHGPNCDPGILKDIHGIIYHDSGKIVATVPRAPLQPLDSLPFPFRGQDDPVYLLSSRGCPFQCVFCSSRAFWGNTRFFSAEYVISEIEELLERNPAVRELAIWDDLFIAHKERFRRFCSLMLEKGLHEKVRVNFSLRADLVDVELCDLLRKLGVKQVGFGAESGSDRVLALLNKQTSVERNQRTIDLLRSYGFTVNCSFIVGSPTETEDEVRSTYEFILQNIMADKIDPAIPVNIMMAIPGTGIWEYAVGKGLVDPASIEWGRLSLFASYRHSNSGSFRQWVELRRQNRSIYLAEDTLPQERLYELMEYYENLISRLERLSALEAENAVLKAGVRGKGLLMKSFGIAKDLARKLAGRN